MYNAALHERRDAWRSKRMTVTYNDQAKQLKEIRQAGFTKLANFSCCQDVLKRLDKAYAAFFRRLRNGEKPGFPRFKAASRFNSISFPAYGDGCRLRRNGKLYVQGVGELRLKLHRPIEGRIKTVTIKRVAGNWYVGFSVVDSPSKPLTPAYSEVGLDMGLESFAVLSDGTIIHNPRFFKHAQRRLRVAQRRLARRQKGSKGWKRASLQVHKVHTHVRRQREDFHHKLTHRIVAQFGLIAIEKLNLKGLAGGMLAKSVSDVGWGNFFEKLAYKAESAGRLLVKVDPRGTSQRCSQCGNLVAKSLEERWHFCASCGLSLPRDLNSAIEILRLGRSLVASTWMGASCVATEADSK